MNKVTRSRILLAVLTLVGFVGRAQHNNATLYGDGSKRLVGHRDYSWNTNTMTWDNTDSSNYLFGANNKINIKNDFKYATTWNNDILHHYTYDANGRILIQTDSSYTNPLLSNRYTYSYAANGQNTIFVRERQDAITLSWQNHTRYQFTYTATGKIHVSVQENWDNNTWVNDSRKIQYYSILDKDSVSRIEEWDSNSNTWNLSAEILFAYDANGNNTVILEQTYNSSLMSLVNYSQHLYSYDAQNKKISERSKFWNSSNNMWLNQYQYRYTYTAQDKRDSVIVDTWNNAVNNWRKFGISKASYNAQGWQILNNNLLWDTISYTYRDHFRVNSTFDNNGYLTHYFEESYNTNLLTWQNANKINFWYESSAALSIPSSLTENDQLQIYPIPSSTNFNVVLPELSKVANIVIYEINGRMIQSMFNLKASGTILLGDNLPIGNYIMLCEIDGKKYTNKITKL